jgi:formamidopyrimidine-DNA glycosylase
MPELPDVELFKRHLDDTSLGRRIGKVAVNDARILASVSAREFSRYLEGKRFEDSRRHGKHLLVRLAGDGWLTMHFGMTGHLHYFEDPADDPKYDRVRFDFERGHLAYVNRRMLGRVGLAEDADAFIRDEELGPDALDAAFDLAALERAIDGRRRDVKSLLMDQSVIAGIGNIYADEILFQARLHPKLPLQELDDRQRKGLFHALKEVLKTAIDSGAGAEQFLERLPSRYLLPAREKGGRCPRCGSEILTFKHQGRTTYFCPKCQPEP